MINLTSLLYSSTYVIAHQAFVSGEFVEVYSLKAAALKLGMNYGYLRAKVGTMEKDHGQPFTYKGHVFSRLGGGWIVYEEGIKLTVHD